MKERNPEVPGRLYLSFTVQRACPWTSLRPTLPLGRPSKQPGRQESTALLSPPLALTGARNMGLLLARAEAPCDAEGPAARLFSPGRNPRPYPRRVNTKGGTTRPRGRTKACSATADSGPPPPAAEAKGHRPRALEPLAPMSGPPAHGEPRGRFALTGPSAPPCPASASARRCCRRRCRCLPQAPGSPRKPHFRFRTLRTLPSLIGCFSRLSAGWDQ